MNNRFWLKNIVSEGVYYFLIDDSDLDPSFQLIDELNAVLLDTYFSYAVKKYDFFSSFYPFLQLVESSFFYIGSSTTCLSHIEIAFFLYLSLDDEYFFFTGLQLYNTLIDSGNLLFYVRAFNHYSTCILLEELLCNSFFRMFLYLGVFCILYAWLSDVFYFYCFVRFVCWTCFLVLHSF